jgi:hypothetical protein
VASSKYPYNFKSPVPSVSWLDFGSILLSDPFYDQTIWNIRSSSRLVTERNTSIEELVQLADSFPPIEPAGIIFHISRCGSTLLTNVLKAGGECTVLSEAPLIDCLVQQDKFQGISVGVEGLENTRRRLLQAVISLYTACFGLQVVIKAHTTNMMHISRLRLIWPWVPFIVNIRNPVEVMASNLAKPSDMMRSILTPYTSHNVFGFTGPETRQMSMEEYCARCLGKLLEAANAQLDDRCWVLDFKNMGIENIYKMAHLLNVRMPETNAEQITNAFLVYSKDRSGESLYESDSDQKQRESPPSVHSLAAQWTLESYQRLLDTPRSLI